MPENQNTRVPERPKLEYTLLSSLHMLLRFQAEYLDLKLDLQLDLAVPFHPYLH